MWLVPPFDSAHSWYIYSAALLEPQAAGTMTCYPSQSHYPDSEPVSSCPILIMPSARLGNDKYTLDLGTKTAIFGFEAMTFGFLV